MPATSRGPPQVRGPDDRLRQLVGQQCQQAADKFLGSLNAVEAAGERESTVDAVDRHLHGPAIALLDHEAPQADVRVPIADKARLAIWDDGSRFWPKLFAKTIFGASLPDGGRLEAAPEPAIAAFERGQLLAYLTEFGIGSSFARPAPDRGPGALVSDFRFLERYETKPDYGFATETLWWFDKDRAAAIGKA